MDIPGTRQRGRSSFPGRGRNQRPRPPLSPSSAAPQPEGAPGAWPLGEGAASSLCLTPCGLLRDPGPGAGLLQHGVTQPSLPAPSLCLLCSCFLVGPPTPESRDFPGSWADLRGFVGPQSSAICCLSLALGLAPPTSGLARAGSACNHVWQGRGPPAAVPSVQPGLCLSGTSQGLLFCSLRAPLPPSAERLLRSSGPKCHPLAGEGGRLSRLGREVHVSTRPASHPTALTEPLGQATRTLPTRLPHAAPSPPWVPCTRAPRLLSEP